MIYLKNLKSKTCQKSFTKLIAKNKPHHKSVFICDANFEKKLQ